MGPGVHQHRCHGFSARVMSNCVLMGNNVMHMYLCSSVNVYGIDYVLSIFLSRMFALHWVNRVIPLLSVSFKMT